MRLKNRTNLYKNIFLDLGGVLFYDEYVLFEFYYKSYSQIIQNVDITSEDFFKARQDLYLQYKSEWLRTYLKTLFNSDKMEEIISESWSSVLRNFSKLFVPYHGSLDFILELKKKYKLYIVANQPKEAQEVLNNMGITKYFEKVYLDADIGLSKPDLKFYEYILNDSGLKAHETIHIGDRIDNDVIPALKLKICPIKLFMPIKKISKEKIDKKFIKNFYNSISNVWHRIEENDLYDYSVFHSYNEILEILN